MKAARARFCVSFLLALRWGALAATGFLSLHHWMRAGYWEFSGVWHYGLPLLDPRFAAALEFWAISTGFWTLLVLPLAVWLAERVPAEATGKTFVAFVLAVGLGTRGVVGPLIMRAALGAPLALALPRASSAPGWLSNPYLARWAVLLTQLGWVLPFLVAALWLLGPETTRRSRIQWAIRGLLAGYALLQPLDAPYLLTAGGPHGATQSLLLLAFQEGFGRQEFGYASTLAILLSVAALPLAVLLSYPLRELPAPEAAPTAAPWRGWWSVALLGLVPLGIAGLRNPAFAAWPTPVWTASLVSLTLAVAGGGWSGFLERALNGAREENRRPLPQVAEYWMLLLPTLTLVLPMIRPWGYQTGWAEGLVLFADLVILAPYLLLSRVTHRLLGRRAVRPQTAGAIAAAVVAWATWTELGLGLMLSQAQHAWLPLQSWMVWDLSATLRASPLGVPGWPVAWLGGTLLAWGALIRLFQAPMDSSPGPVPGRD